MLPPSLQHWCSLLSFYPHQIWQARCQGAACRAPIPARRSPGSGTSALLQPPFLGWQRARLISTGLSPPPGLPCLLQHICSLHLLPLSSGCDRAARPVGVPSRDLQECHLLVADLAQLRRRGQCRSVPCSVLSARLRCTSHARDTRLRLRADLHPCGESRDAAWL